ncbi:hypothetical protein HQ571_04770 [Candidatus Kuenenbacteria bacterium]|nr:hypothetical protein [Candidatus Kuenenbacteria bacterium]
MNIIFLQNKAQVLEVKQNSELHSFENIPLTAEAFYWLDRLEMKYDLLENYVKEILPEDIKISYYESTKNVLSYLDEQFLLQTKNGLKPFSSDFINFYTSFTCAKRIIRLLDEYLKVKATSLDSIYNFENKESLIAQIIPLLAKKYNIVTNQLPGLINPKIRLNLRQYITKKAKGSAVIQKLYISRFFFKFTKNKGHKAQEIILALNYTYDVKKVLQELLKQNHKIYFWDPLRIKNPFKLNNVLAIIKVRQKSATSNAYYNFLENIIKDETLIKSFEYLGVNYFACIKKDLKKFILTTIPQAEDVYNQTISLLEDAPIKMLLCSGVYNPINKSIVKAFKNKNLPVIVYQHGPM